MPDNPAPQEWSKENIAPEGFHVNLVPFGQPGVLPTATSHADNRPPLGSSQRPDDRILREYPRDRGSRPPQ
jgi:hypothetical protein